MATTTAMTFSGRWGSLVVRRSRQWYGKRKTMERGTRLVRGKELVWRLMIFGFVKVGEG
ncbi:hypothetical protein KY285_001031 [Solanum tuberosum]|nr:hypothetical protein KY285_001031 [Solanum tuberosum]